MKRILYIGNNLSSKSKYNSTIATLSTLLKEEGLSVSCSSSKSNKFLRLLAMCIAIITNRNKVDFILIDTFSTTNFYFALITSQLARLFSLKYISILHGGNLPFRLDKSVFLSNLIFNNSYKNISPSSYLMEEFRLRGYNTVYIPNGILIKAYDYKKRSKLKPMVLWVRAFDKTYNPQLAIKVIALVKLRYKNVKLCMVGPEKDGSLHETKLLVKKLNLEKNCSFTGVLAKEKWHEISKDFDIFINTTNIDNMPVSIIEAMALGFPVISTNVGGLPYLITDKSDGILVPPNNEKEMANAIINLINNPLNSEELSLNARRKAESFDLDKVKQLWLSILT
ncbi:glycosyltransferase family 4 protein [Lutibacter sp.]